jgi:hypothetical protein
MLSILPQPSDVPLETDPYDPYFFAKMRTLAWLGFPTA